MPGPRLLEEPIVETVTYFDNNLYRTVTYTGALWELQPVEVRTVEQPEAPVEELPEIERELLEAELGGESGVADLKQYLVDNSLALVISRDVTVRGDKQQDIDLKVSGSDHQTAGPGTTPKEIAWLQFFEGRLLRGSGYKDGRRVLARPMDSAPLPDEPAAPEGAVKIAEDGSMAAFVPASRALSWQTTELDGTPAVRERYWLTFQPGEIRACTNCHGLNNNDVFNKPGPTNAPQALVDLLDWWKAEMGQ